MTSAERSVLADVLEILQRVDGRVEKLDGRLRAVEDYITVDRTRNEAAVEAKAANRLNRAQIITALGIAGSFVLGLVNHFS